MGLPVKNGVRVGVPKPSSVLRLEASLEILPLFLRG